MQYRLEILTDDPNSEDIYYPSGKPSVGAHMCKPKLVSSNLLRNVKRQAETQIIKVLSHQYNKTSPECVTHELDMDAVWKYTDGTRTALSKRVYAAYKHDFEGYQRYKAVLTPTE